MWDSTKERSRIPQYFQILWNDSTNYPHPRLFSTGQVFRGNRFRFRKSISTSDSTNKIRTFFVEFGFVNSAFANTLMDFFSVRCIIPLFHPPIGVYTRYFLTLSAIIECLRKRNSQIRFHKKSPDFICGIGSGNGLAKAESISTKYLTGRK